ncbi:uncharacterized protein LOC119726979 [Patiria miniata]|uniref:Uncharacterized protein n=1 Tax=Patiria miniata TaxID=46514 RepID=A0A913ZUL1_PATMI|nr:uncharacterized protein LOC119726979 [Patiria miniata]
MDMKVESTRSKRRGSSLQNSPCDIDQATDSSDVSQSGSGLLSRRPKQSRHMPIIRAHHQRAHTAPQHQEGRLSSSSSSSSLTIDSGEESNQSSGSSYQGKRPSTGTYSCHISCRVSPDKPGHFEYLRPYSVFRSPLKRSRSVPISFSESYRLQHPDLSKGQKTYLWHTAAVYSMTNMKALQERRYKQLLQHQVDIGFHTQEECDRYLNYLLGSRKHQYMADPRVWREPPKIPVRPKYFHHPPPSKSQSPRDYRFFPRGYEGSTKDVSDDDKDKTEDTEKYEYQAKDKGQADNLNQGKDRPTDEERSHTDEAGQLDGTEKAVDENKKDDMHREGQDSHSVSDDEQSLSESMQGVSLFYDPKRKTTVTRGQKANQEESGKENANLEGSQKSLKISHQNCFWGSL